MEHSSGTFRIACNIKVDGMGGPERPRMAWKKWLENKCCEWKLITINPKEKNTWQSDMGSALYAASQLPGRRFYFI